MAFCFQTTIFLPFPLSALCLVLNFLLLSCSLCAAHFFSRVVCWLVLRQAFSASFPFSKPFFSIFSRFSPLTFLLCAVDIISISTLAPINNFEFSKSRHEPINAKGIFGNFPTIYKSQLRGAVIAKNDSQQLEKMMNEDKMHQKPSTSIATTSMNNQIDFRSDEQPSQIMKNLKIFREDQHLCDVELEIDNDVITAHRYILAAASPYFRAMFTNGMAEMSKTKIELNDISKESLRQLIDFIYTNEIVINGSNVQNLLFAASILQMDDIIGACQQFLTKTITISNCIALHQFAEIYNCTALLTATDNFAVDNFRELRKLSDFNSISFNHLKIILMRSDLNVNHEIEVFETIITWIETDYDSRHQHLVDLLSAVRLPLLGWKYLMDVVKLHPYIKSNPVCRESVSNALFHIFTPLKKIGEIEKQCQDRVEGGGEYTTISIKPAPLAPCNLSADSLNRWQPRKSVAGIIFCAGGRGTLGDPFRSVEAYDWRRNAWFSIADMTTQRRHVGVVSASECLYAIGGHDGETHLSSAEIFEPTIGVWRTISSMSTARRGIAVAALDQAIYAVGGLDDSTCFKTVERYDIELDQWSPVANMTVQRGGVGVSVIGKYLFAIGGNDGTSSLDSCERFDPLLDRWRVIANMQNRRAGAGVCVLDGYLYAIGGFDDNAPLATCERYDVDLDVWHPIANMISPRGGVGVAAMGGKVYAIGGHDGVKYLNTVECYDPLTNSWATISSIKECRAGAGVTWADCRVDQLTRHKCDSGCAPSSGSQCI